MTLLKRNHTTSTSIEIILHITTRSSQIEKIVNNLPKYTYSNTKYMYPTNCSPVRNNWGKVRILNPLYLDTSVPRSIK